MLFSGKYKTAKEALKYYGQKRAHDEKGVTIPSQRRYVEYYEHLKKNNIRYQRVSLQVSVIMLEL
jgi:phosphatidylinositol-3,4,5-trisphosphate 3-phosphatase and dual-specificity protein phosphatase PTEN